MEIESFREFRNRANALSLIFRFFLSCREFLLGVGMKFTLRDLYYDFDKKKRSFNKGNFSRLFFKRKFNKRLMKFYTWSRGEGGEYSCRAILVKHSLRIDRRLLT